MTISPAEGQRLKSPKLVRKIPVNKETEKTLIIYKDYKLFSQTPLANNENGYVRGKRTVTRLRKKYPYAQFTYEVE